MWPLWCSSADWLDLFLMVQPVPQGIIPGIFEIGIVFGMGEFASG